MKIKHGLFLLITISAVVCVSSSVYSENEFTQKAEALTKRLYALEKSSKAFTYLDNRLNDIAENVHSYSEDDISKVVSAFKELAIFTKQEIELDPMEKSYQENIDLFIRNSQAIFPDIFGSIGSIPPDPPDIGEVRITPN